MDSAPSTSQSPGAADLAGLLPPLLEDRSAAAVFSDELLGKDFVRCSTNALQELDYLRLNSPLNGTAWGVWQFSPGPRRLVSVEATISVASGADVCFAVADFIRNRWQITGPFSGGKILPLNDQFNRSPAGQCYIAVITAGGSSAVVHKLILSTEHPWSVTTVNSTNNAGLYSSLAEVDGNPAICYCEAFNPAGESVLKFVRALDALGADWAAPVPLSSSGNAHAHTSLVVVDGFPAVSFQWISWFPAIDAGGVLMYKRATDATGAGWGETKVLNADPFNHDYLGAYNSLAVVDGVPAISYRSDMYKSLRYIAALDAGGEAWGSPQSLEDSDHDVGFYTTLVAPSGGQPMICYYDATNGNLKGIGMNAAGTSWNPPFYIDGSGDDVGQWASGTLVLNDLAVCYYNATVEELRLARYIILAGEWVSVRVAASGEASHLSLAVIDGNPAACYYDVEHGDLKYVRALDAGGQNWGAVETVDSLGNVGTHASLAEVGGLAAISYHDEDNQDLKFAVRLGP